jgi:hypothetical protein
MNDLVLAEGDRVVATGTHQWTLDEFEEYSLIVEPGDEAIVSELMRNPGVCGWHGIKMNTQYRKR